MGELVFCNVSGEIKYKTDYSDLLCASATLTVNKHGGSGKYSITIVIASAASIKALNKKYYNKNVPTDVLSFDSSEEHSHGVKYLGEVVICPSFIKNSMSADKSFEWEISHVAVHGTMHLLGFDHQDDDSYKKLHALEEKIINKILKAL